MTANNRPERVLFSALPHTSPPMGHSSPSSFVHRSNADRGHFPQNFPCQTLPLPQTIPMEHQC